MKREQHKLAVRSRVLEVAKGLFVTKGYSKTTIKEITQQADITTGSLYHFFKDKEDILLHITREMFDLSAITSDQILPEDADPWLRLSVELGMQLRLILSHKPIGELYLTAYESPIISQGIVQKAHARIHKTFKGFLPHVPDDEFYLMCLSIKGIMHSFVQASIHGKDPMDATLIFRALDMVLLICHIPEDRKDEVIAKTRKMIEGGAQ